ncbi:MAG: Uma2 family endonuclease [Lachnospiraceae bacterium]|jgi:Uma2 family endonuclease|nr:Uma2 family endonuclease [Lachnospiraceae bacterium]
MELQKNEYKKEEKINGVVYAMSPSPHFRHGVIDGNIYSKIKSGLKDSLCLVFMENLDYRYHPEENDDYVVPDIMIVCDRKQLKGGSYYGVPRFIAETLSPATAMKDKTVKKDLYEQAGVEEYWIVSPKEHAVDIYYLEDKRYVLKNSYILQEEEDEEAYNAETEISLRAFPTIKMKLREIFEGIE